MTSELSYRSTTQHIVWPAIPSRQGGALAAILMQLEQSQWWPPARLQAMQYQQLTQLCSHAAQQVPFYRQRFATLDWKPGQAMTPEIWARLPLLTRDDIQGEGSNLEADVLPKSHGGTGRSTTSGSTAKPIAFVSSGLSRMYWEALTLRDHFWQQRDLSAKLAAIRSGETGYAPYPKGVRGRSWGGASRRLFNTGIGVSLNVHCTAEQQLDWLRREKPGYLITFPSVAGDLAKLSLASGRGIPGLKAVQTISEVLHPATRKLCEDAWGVPVTDIYSAREAGYLALQCPEGPHYHIQSETVLVELLLPDGAPCKAGETGRVVVTPLHNFAMPLIRYDIGDDAELGAPCPCGRGLPVITRIAGRKRDRVFLPDGRVLWASLTQGHATALVAVEPLKQFQLVQTSLQAAEMRIRTTRLLEPTEEERVKFIAQDILDYPMEITITYHDEIPRGPSGKFQFFVQAMENPAQ